MVEARELVPITDSNADLAKTNRRLAAINSMASAVNTSLDVAEILDGVVQRSREALNADAAMVMLLDKRTKELTPVAYQGLSEAFLSEHARRKRKVGEGIAGRVVASGQPIIVADALKERRLRRGPIRDEGGQSFIIVPLHGREEILGTLGASHRQAEHYGSEDVELLQALADLAGLALDNARHFEQQQQRTSELEAMRQMALALGAELELPRVLDMAISLACQLTGAESANILLWDEEGKLLRHAAALNLPPEVASRPVSLGEGAAGTIALTQKPLLINRYQRYAKRLPWVPQDANFIGVPIVFGSELLGVLAASDFLLQRPFTQHDLELVEILASHAAIAIYKARLLKEQREMVTRLQLLHDASTAVAQSLDLEQTLNTIVNHIGRTLDLDVCQIRMADAAGTWQIKAAYFISPEREQRYWAVAVQFPLRVGEGVANAALAGSGPVLVEDCATDPRLLPPYQGLYESGTRMLIAPLHLKQGPAAVMTLIARPEKRRLSAADFPLVTSLAEIAAAAIDRASAYATQQRYASQVTSLLQMTEDINSQLDMTPLLRRITQRAVEITDARTGWVGLEEEGQIMMWEWWDGESWHSDVHIWSEGKGVPGWVWHTGKPYVGNDATNDPHATSNLVATYRLRSFVMVPILNRWGVFLGVITVTNKKKGALFNDEDVQLLEAFARQAAVAIENARLFREVGQVEALEELNRLKDEFIATASHELRAPLIPLVGYSELLAHRDMLPQEVKRTAARLHQEAQRLTRMVDELLDLARLEQGQLKLEKQPTNIDELLREATQKTAPVSSLHHIDIVTNSSLPPIPLDRARILQVLDNLLTNAIKYSPAGGHIMLGARQEPAGVTIWVSDEGVGIPNDALKKVFDKFYRVDNPVTRKVRGTGLGLSISRNIVEAHGGKMGAESQVGVGSTFCFTLPLSP